MVTVEGRSIDPQLALAIKQAVGRHLRAMALLERAPTQLHLDNARATQRQAELLALYAAEEAAPRPLDVPALRLGDERSPRPAREASS